MRPPGPPRRARLVGMLVLGIAVVFLLTSPTWFATGQDGVAVAQILLGFALAAIGVWLYRAAARTG